MPTTRGIEAAPAASYAVSAAKCQAGLPKRKKPAQGRLFLDAFLRVFQPFVAIGGWGAVVQLTMLRRESTATTASASLFMKWLSLIGARTL
jgi:hypothetical protein